LPLVNKKTRTKTIFIKRKQYGYRTSGINREPIQHPRIQFDQSSLIIIYRPLWINHGRSKALKSSAFLSPRWINAV
jgi:hypothetical protein